MKKLQFGHIFFLTGGVFAFFVTVSSLFDVHLIFPVFAFLAYGTLIGGLLWSVCLAKLRWHYLISSVSLVLLGTMASVDILLSKSEMLVVLNQQFEMLITKEHLDDAVQVLLVLVNIFTGSLAADVMFHGLRLKPVSVDSMDRD